MAGVKVFAAYLVLTGGHSTGTRCVAVARTESAHDDKFKFEFSENIYLKLYLADPNFHADQKYSDKKKQMES